MNDLYIDIDFWAEMAVLVIAAALCAHGGVCAFANMRTGGGQRMHQRLLRLYGRVLRALLWVPLVWGLERLGTLVLWGLGRLGAGVIALCRAGWRALWRA